MPLRARGVVEIQWRNFASGVKDTGKSCAGKVNVPLVWVVYWIQERLQEWENTEFIYPFLLHTVQDSFSIVIR